MRFLLSTAFIVLAAACASSDDVSSSTDSELSKNAPAGSIVTQRYDNARSGINASETTLTLPVVAGRFGKVAESKVLDGSAIYAQPLFVPSIGIKGGAPTDVLYVETFANTLFVLDTKNGLSVITSRSFGNPWFNPKTNTPSGMMSTPVIDRSAGLLYVVTRDLAGDFYLRALRLTTLDDVRVTKIAATGPNGTAFKPTVHFQRPGLLLQNGRIYVAFGSNPTAQDEKTSLYRGWILGYDAATLAQKSVYCTSPDPTDPTSSGKAGIWQSGTGLVADANGIYFSTGNGPWDGTSHFGDSINRIGYPGSRLSATASFNPPRGKVGELLDVQDLDIGSSAPALIGDNLLVAGGKEGILYLLDRTKTPMPLLQSFRATYNQFDHTYCEPAVPSCGDGARPGPGVTPRSPGQMGVIVDGQPTVVTSCTTYQARSNSKTETDTSYYQVTGKFPHIHTPPLYFAPAGLVYVWAERDTLRAFDFDAKAGRFTGQPGATAELFCPNVHFGSPLHNAGENGGFLTLSWDGSNPATAIVWAMANDAPGKDPGEAHAVLHAYRAVTNASGSLDELWNSDMDPSSTLPASIGHFPVPVVGNGRVYVTSGEYSNGKIVAFGERPGPVFQPVGQWLTGWGKPDFAATGDFNGDGKTDLLWYEQAKNNGVTIALSTGTGFNVAGQWLTGWGKPDWAGVGDVNGDGRDDLLWYEQWNNNGLTIALSTGTGFNVAGQWLTGWGKPDWAAVGKLNNDRYADLLWYEQWNNHGMTVALSTGSGFTPSGQWMSDWGMPDWASVGDVDGDGLDDVLWYEQWKNHGMSVLSSTGAGFRNAGQWLTGWGMPDWAGAGKFTADKYADVAWFEAWNVGTVTVAQSDGASRFTDSGPWLSSWGKPDLALVGDFDGDHRSDLLWYEQWKNNGITIALAR